MPNMPLGPNLNHRLGFQGSVPRVLGCMPHMLGRHEQYQRTVPVTQKEPVPIGNLIRIQSRRNLHVHLRPRPHLVHAWTQIQILTLILTHALISAPRSSLMHLQFGPAVL